MLCPKCNSPNHSVKDSRAARNLNRIGNFIYRRRACLNCKHRWTTREKPSLNPYNPKESKLIELMDDIEEAWNTFTSKSKVRSKERLSIVIAEILIKKGYKKGGSNG